MPAWPTIAGGTAPTDTDLDGMPDTWETWYGTDPAAPSNNVVGQDGSTALGLYLQWLIDPGGVALLARGALRSDSGPRGAKIGLFRGDFDLRG